MTNSHWEPLGKKNKILVSKKHGFTTDTLLLANFAKPNKRDICADFGTGCGTIAVLWDIRYSPKIIYAVELQKEATEQLEQTIDYNKLEKITLIKDNINNYKSIFKSGSLSHIACNPPYKAIGAGIKNEVDNLRIARHEDELSLDELAKAASYCLKFGGKLFICQRPERLSDAITIFRENGLEPKRLRLVQQRETKAPSLFLLESRRGGNSGIDIMPTLFIEKDGGLSEEMINIYGNYKEEHYE